MPDSKHMRWVDSLRTDAEPDPKAEDATLDSVEPAANDADGWQQYRRSRVHPDRQSDQSGGGR